MKTEQKTPRVNRETLFEILSFARPHDSPCEKAFCKEFIDKAHPDMMQDAFGNRILRIGSAPILWSSHVDTVAAAGGPQLLNFDTETGIVELAAGKPGMSLGADDGVGIWIMLALIEKGMEGLYVFHRGEEKGCLGSRWIVNNTPDLLTGIDAAIAFDRAGYRDIITHQSFGMTASDKFAWSLAAQLNKVGTLRFQPDDTGVYTDTNEYAHLIPECTNVSVGYYGQHTSGETLDVHHAEELLSAVLMLDLDAFHIERTPGEGGWDIGRPAIRKRYASKLADDMLLQAVEMMPETVARFLQAEGYCLDNLLDFRWEEGDDPEDELDRAYERAWGGEVELEDEAA